MKINLDDVVRVRLTDFGRTVHRMAHDQFVQAAKVTVRYEPPPVDDDGYSQFRLRDFMFTFGSNMGFGDLAVISPEAIERVQDCRKIEARIASLEQKLESAIVEIANLGVAASRWQRAGKNDRPPRYITLRVLAADGQQTVLIRRESEVRSDFGINISVTERPLMVIAVSDDFVPESPTKFRCQNADGEWMIWTREPCRHPRGWVFLLGKPDKIEPHGTER